MREREEKKKLKKREEGKEEEEEEEGGGGGNLRTSDLGAFAFGVFVFVFVFARRTSGSSARREEKREERMENFERDFRTRLIAKQRTKSNIHPPDYSFFCSFVCFECVPQEVGQKRYC